MALLACLLSLSLSLAAFVMPEPVVHQLSSAQLSESLRAIGRMQYLVRNIFHVLSMSSTVQARPEMSLLCNNAAKASKPMDLNGYRCPL